MSGLLPLLLPDGVRGAELFDLGQSVAMPPEDAALVAGTSDARRRDFALGRACARAALAELGAPGAVGRQPHGAPLWPPGITGSITHCHGYAAAIVARQADFSGLGVDAEQVGRVEDALWPRLFDARERAWLAARGRDQAEMATLLFAAKEAAFKASNPGPGAALQFQALHISVTGAGTFQVHGQSGAGRYVSGSGLVLACVFAR